MKEVEMFRKKFKCFNKDGVELWGDFNSLKTQQLAIKFKMCKEKPICEDEEVIKDWLKGKYILILYN